MPSEADPRGSNPANDSDGANDNQPCEPSSQSLRRPRPAAPSPAQPMRGLSRSGAALYGLAIAALRQGRRGGAGRGRVGPTDRLAIRRGVSPRQGGPQARMDWRAGQCWQCWHWPAGAVSLQQCPHLVRRQRLRRGGRGLDGLDDLDDLVQRNPMRVFPPRYDRPWSKGSRSAKMQTRRICKIKPP